MPIYKEDPLIIQRVPIYIYISIMELGPTRPLLLWRWKLNSIMEVSIDPLGLGRYTTALLKGSFGETPLGNLLCGSSRVLGGPSPKDQAGAARGWHCPQPKGLGGLR